MSDETEREAAMLWGAQKFIVAKEARKRRAIDGLPEKASLVHDERKFKFELNRTLADDLPVQDQHLAAVREVAKRICGIATTCSASMCFGTRREAACV